MFPLVNEISMIVKTIKLANNAVNLGLQAAPGKN